MHSAASYPTYIPFKNITYQIHNTQKYIFNNLTGIFPSGSLSAIMGPSGSGKTTLLNILTGRITSQHFQGQLIVNGVSYSSQKFGNFGNYVMQHDILMQTLTVRETLKFAADLKVEGSEQEKSAKIDFLAQKLKLQNCLDVIVGGRILKGISGGRTSIAFELLSNPSVLILDQPTSGLDSLTSFIIIDYLKQLANVEGKTVILSIHQPSSQIFMKFDKLVLMTEGFIVYQGFPDGCLTYFKQNNNVFCPFFFNIADFLVEVLHRTAHSRPKDLSLFTQTYKNIILPEEQKQINLDHPYHIPKRKFIVSQWSAFKTLLYRDFLNVKRHPFLTKVRLFGIIFSALFTGFILQNHNDNYSDLINWNSTLGVLYIASLGMLMFTMAPIALTFPLQRVVFLKEANAKLYSVFTYFLSRCVIDLPYTFIVPILMAVIAYWLIGLSNTANQFFILVLDCVVVAFTGSSMGLLVGSVVDDYKSASVVMTFLLVPSSYFSGLYKNLGNLPVWIGWVQYISSMRYGWAAMVQNEVQYSSAPYLDSMNFSTGMWANIFLSLLLGILFRVLSLYLLWRFRVKN